MLIDTYRNEIDRLVASWELDEAISYINELLADDPTDQELLLMIADIQYKQWEITKASKVVDFLNANTNHTDPMALYVKWVLEMEKNHRKVAREFFLKAMHRLETDNYEVMRCYALSEYRYGNREKWVYHLERAHDLNVYDAEIIYNMIEIYLLEKKFAKAEALIEFFNAHLESLELSEKPLSYYQWKINIFSWYIATYYKKKQQS